MFLRAPRLREYACLSTLLCHLIFLCAARPAQAEQLYAYRSGRGITFTTSKPPDGKAYWPVRPRQPSYSSFVFRGSSYQWVGYAVASRYDDIILQLARSYQVEPALVKAVMHVESAFNPGARSPKGAMGLMQLMPGTAQRFGIQNPYNPVENVVGGVRYLQWLFRHFDGNVVHVLAGYNAGENAVSRHGGVPPYTETKDYVRRVLRMMDLYRRDYTGQSAS